MRGGIFISASSVFEIARDAYVNTLEAESDTAPNQRSALIAVVFSAVALEGVVNESAEYAEMVLQTTSGTDEPEWVSTFVYLMKEAEEMRAPIQVKFALAHFAISGRFPDKGSQPYQDFDLLIKVRNALAHLKPLDKIESPSEGVTSPKIIQQLEPKKLLASVTGTTNTSWTELLKTRAVARWACDTTSAMVYSLLNAMPEGPPRGRAVEFGMESFYRRGFRPTSQIEN